MQDDSQKVFQNTTTTQARAAADKAKIMAQRAQAAKDRVSDSIHFLDDENGNHIGYQTVSPEVSQRVRSGEKIQYYQQQDGSWDTTLKPYVSLDKESGKITIAAPQSMLERPHFQNYKSTLEKLSQYYKADHNAEVADPTDVSGQKTISVEEYVNRINDDMSGLYQLYTATDEENEKVKAAGLDPLSEAQMVYMSQQTFDPEDDKLSKEIGQNRLLVPDLEEFNIYKQAETFNKDLGGVGSVTVQDAHDNIHSREEALDGEDADARITRQREVLKQKIDNNDYSSTDDYIATQAMYSYLTNVKPETAWYRTVVDVGNNLILGLGSGVATVTAGIASGAEGVVNWATGRDQDPLGTRFLGTGLNGDTYDEAHGWEKTYDDLQYLIQQHYANTSYLTAAGANTYLGADVVGQFAATMAIGAVVGNVLSEVAGATALMGANAISSAAESAVADAVAGSALTTVSSLMASGEASMLAGLSVSELAGIGTLASYGAGALAFIGAHSALTSAVLSGTAGIGTILSSLNTTKAALTGVSAAVAAVDIVSGSMLDAATTDPKLFRDILENDTNEGSQYMFEQFAWNVAGWGAFTAGGKLVTAGLSTRPGQILTATAGTKLNRIEAAMGNLNQRIKTFVFNADESTRIENLQNAIKSSERRTARAQNKGNVAAQRKLIREQKELIGDLRILSENADATWENVVRYNKEANELKNLYNQIDNLRAGVREQIKLQEIDNDQIRAAREMRLDTSRQIVKLEKQSGLYATKGTEYLQDGTKIFSSETSNYIGARLQMDSDLRRIDPAAYNIDAPALTGKKLEEAQARIADYNAKIDTFKEVATPELVETADNYITAFRSESQGLMQWGINNDVVDEAEYASYLATQYWGEQGELYGVTQRKTQWQEYVRQRADGKIDAKGQFTIQHRAPLAEGDFVDPNLAITDMAMTLAHSKIMNDASLTILAGAGVKANVKATGEVVSTTKDASALGKVYNTKVKETLPSISDSIKESGIASDIISKNPQNNVQRAATNDIAAIEKARDARIAEITEAKSKSVRAKSRKNLAVGGFSDDVTQEVLTQNGLKPISTQVVDQSSYNRLILSDDSPLSAETRDIIRNEVEDFAESTGKNADDFKTYQQVIKSNENILQRADSAQITSDPDIMNSQMVKDEVAKFYTDENIAQIRQSYDAQIDPLAEKLGYKDGVTLQGAINNQANTIVDDFVDAVTEGGVSEELTARLKKLKDNADEATDIEQEFLALQSLKDNKKEIKKMVGDTLDNELKADIKGSGRRMEIDDADAYTKALQDQVEREIETRYNSVRQQLADNNSPLVDYKDWMSEVDEAQKAIGDTKAGKNIIQTRDAQGRIQYVETDPIVANLLNYRVPNGELSTISKLNYVWNKIFRFGTTGFRLASYVNQGFRDTINAFVGGNMYRTMSGAIDDMAPFLGQEFVDEFKRLNPQMYEKIAKNAAESGSDVAQNIARFELQRGRQLASGASETLSYARSNTNQAQWRYVDNGYTNANGVRLEKTFDDITEKFMKPHDFRENTLRNTVYSNAYADAIKRGETVAQARISAQFAQRTATTNFGIATYHLSSLRDSVPYLGAAVNGTKSFYRLLSLDPVGVMGRMFMGVGAPMMALTAMSLGTEENRKIWRNIPEYQKDGNIIFVCNGQVVSIPIPEEMSAVLSPFRHFIEQMYDANPHGFTELAISDVLGLSPINIDGFYNLDQSAIMGNPTLLEHMEAGTSRLFAQVAPPLVKSAYIYLTGVDPLSGVKIDTTYSTYDEASGQSVVLDEKSGSFAKWLHSIFGDNLSAPVAQKILENFVGKGLTPALDLLADCCAWVNDSKSVNPLINLGESLSADLASPLTVEKRNTADLQWRIGLSQAYDTKEALLNDNAYQQVVSKINNATSIEEKQKYINDRNNMIQEKFYNQVETLVHQFIDQYAGSFTQYKFASLISLMNIEDVAPTTSAVGQIASEDIRAQGKAAALETMYQMGFGQYQNMDILGTVRTSASGETYIDWNTPLGILSTERALAVEDETITAGIQLKMREGTNLEQAYYDVQDQIQAIYNKEKLTSSDYNQIDAIKANWNAQVMERLGPYMQQYGLAKVLNDRETIDYLQKYIQVPSAYEVDKRGRRISAPNLNKQQGFSPNYIRAIFAEYDKRMKGGK